LNYIRALASAGSGLASLPHRTGPAAWLVLLCRSWFWLGRLVRFASRAGPGGPAATAASRSRRSSPSRGTKSMR